MELEVTASRAELPGQGRIAMTGMAEEEEMGSRSRTIRRKSMAKGSIENVMTVLQRMGVRPYDYDLHINFPGENLIQSQKQALTGVSLSFAENVAEQSHV